MVLAASDSGFFGVLHDFFGSGTWPIVRNLALFLLVVFWLAVGYWVFKDARRRIEDPWLVGAATILGLIPPFIGALIYALLSVFASDILVTFGMSGERFKLVVGLGFLAVVLFSPDGMLGLWERLKMRMERRERDLRPGNGEARP